MLIHRKIPGLYKAEIPSASLPPGLISGNYVAMVRGTVNQSLSITINN